MESNRLSAEDVQKMRIPELRTYLKSRGISMVGCVEKSDLVTLVVANETSDQPKMPRAAPKDGPKTTYSSTGSGEKFSTGEPKPTNTNYSSSTGTGAYNYSATSGGYGGYPGAGGYSPYGSSYEGWGNTNQGTAPAPPKKRIVDDRSYYEILGVDKEATPAQIKKGYYKMARKYHPDKNPDDEVAEEMFKLISEAYDVLSNEEKRAMYDKFGKEYIRSADSGGADFGNLLTMLFGGGQFDDVFGDLSILEMLQNMDMESPSSAAEQMKKDEEYEKKIGMLIEKLRSEKLAPYIGGNEKEFKLTNQKDIDEKMKAPGGPSLLSSIGYVYVQIAKQHSERWFGLESFMSGIQEKGHLVTSTVSILNDMRKMAKLQQELEGEGEAMSTEAQQKAMDHGLNIMWKMGKLEIESTVKTVCNRIIKECKSKDEKKRTVAALRALGNMYIAAGKKVAGKSRSAPSFESATQARQGAKGDKEKGGTKNKSKDKKKPSTTAKGSYTFASTGEQSTATKSSGETPEVTTKEPTETNKSSEEPTDGTPLDMDGLD